MASQDLVRPRGGGLRALLLPDRPRHWPWARPAQLILRSLHLAGMGLVLGALPFTQDPAPIRGAIALTVATGLGLFLIDLGRDAAILVQGSGVAVLLKLGLLGLGALQPAHRLPWYLAATLVASVGSHMPGSWRHFSFLTWTVVKHPD